MAAAKVFISYRREDSAAYAGRVRDRLEREFGRDLLFLDVDTIPLGTNFSNVLHEEIAKCGVLLAIIGPNWLDARDEHGSRRLDDSNDFVRIEITAALQRAGDSCVAAQAGERRVSPAVVRLPASGVRDVHGYS
jgi:hypothetical protein